MIDTHTHIYDPEAFKEGADKAVERALNSGIKKLILPNVNSKSADSVISLHQSFPLCTSVAAGLHPCDAKENWREELNDIFKKFEQVSICAIGEIGIDLYWDSTYLDRQKELFITQISIAREKSVPMIIHCREALDVTLEILDKYGKDVPAVFHSFTGKPQDVEKIREVGDYYFGINGVVTFKNASSLRESLEEIGMNRILLETDSPYLAPVPYRGRRNESSYLPLICEKIADIMHVDSSLVEQHTDINAKDLFRLDL